MSNVELARMGKLRRVLRLAAHGKGVGASIVETFRDSRSPAEVEMVRKILLGRPIDESILALTEKKTQSRDLLLYVVNQARVNASEASRRADRLSILFEHWVWMKRQRLMDQRVMEFRSLIVSAVLGGVTAMIAELAPMLSSFQLTFSPQPAPFSYAPYLGILFVLPGASFLGFFFSRRRAYINVLLSAGAYLIAAYFFAQLLVGV